MSKYGAVRTEVDGVVFASRAESRYYQQLRNLELCGLIRDLELQPRYSLVVNGHKIADYLADFRYYDIIACREVVADVKSKPTMTPVYRLKKKLVKAIYGIEIQEVKA